jgi:hypothetical protein
LQLLSESYTALGLLQVYLAAVAYLRVSSCACSDW